MPQNNFSFYIWQNGLCISYLLRLNQLRQYILQNGGVETEEAHKADFVLIGACGAFLPDFSVYAAKMQDIAKLENTVVVFGCLPIIDRTFFKKNTPRLDLFVPARYPERIENIIPPINTPFNKIMIPGIFRKQDYVSFDPTRRFLLIQEGCTEGCAYCPHQLSIGAEKSQPLEVLCKQTSEGVAQGVKTFVLEGNNGGSWGLDLNPKQTYTDMINTITPLLGDAVLHIGDFAPKWVRLYGETLLHPKIVDIKIPLQTLNGKVLEKLGRDPYSKEMSPLLKKIKEVKPDTFLRTEIIIGLPTSTKEDLVRTLDFVTEHFDKVACFSFDVHPSCKINKMDIELYDDKHIAEHIHFAMDYFDKRPDIKADFDSRGQVLAGITEIERINMDGVTAEYKKEQES
ncbi:hypothetical protein D0S45_07785 [Marinifilum sp. JC120]|nr:hypothetical protein D0S45_07785 [Marinifilum sp. JC120]